jgi:hypothetical protein
MVICRQMTYLIFGGTENVKKRFQIEMLERFKAIHVSRTKPGSSGMICCIGILQIKANDRWHWHYDDTRVCVSSLRFGLWVGQLPDTPSALNLLTTLTVLTKIFARAWPGFVCPQIQVAQSESKPEVTSLMTSS